MKTAPSLMRLLKVSLPTVKVKYNSNGIEGQKLTEPGNNL